MSMVLPIQIEAGEGESINSFLLRMAAANRIRSSDDLLRATGLTPTGFKAAISQIRQGTGLKKGAFSGLRPEILPDFTQKGRVTVGGMTIGAYHYDIERRRYAVSFLREQEYYPSVWQFDVLGFCPYTFEILRERCPYEGCRRTLSWRVCRGAKYCDKCGYNLTLATPVFLPQEDREAVEPLFNFHFGNELERSKAAVSLAPLYRNLTAGDLVQLPVVLGRAVRAHNGIIRDYRSRHDSPAILAEYIEGAKAIMNPEIIQNIVAGESPLRASPFISRLRNSAKDGFTPGVLNAVAQITSVLRTRLPHHFSDIRRERMRLDLMSVTEIAAELGIPDKSRVRDVIDAGILKTETDPGDFMRVQYVRRSDFQELVKGVADRLSLDEVFARTGWRFHQVDQLVKAGMLFWHPNLAVQLLYKGQYLDRAVFEALLGRLQESLKPAKMTSDRLRLSKLFSMMGAAHKPLAQMLALQLLPKGSKTLALIDPAGQPSLSNLAVSSHMIGLVASGNVPWRPVVYDRHFMSQLEAQEYLLVQAKNISQLLKCGELEYAAIHSPNLVVESVVAVGERYISTLEICARTSVKSRAVFKWMRDRNLKKPSPKHDLWLRSEVEIYLPPRRCVDAGSDGPVLDSSTSNVPESVALDTARGVETRPERAPVVKEGCAA